MIVNIFIDADTLIDYIYITLPIFDFPPAD